MDWNHWVALALLAAAAWSLRIRLTAARRASAMAHWTVVQGRVVSHDIAVSTSHDADGDRDTSYTPQLVYAYAAGGGERRGSRLSLDGVSFGSRGEAQDYLDARPLGAAVDVYVNPNDPADAVLTTAHPTDWWVPMMFTALAAAVAAGMFGS